MGTSLCNRSALIVGIPHFADVEFDPLPCAANDATRLFQVLTAYGGFDPENVSVLAAPPSGETGKLTLDLQLREPTRSEILSELRRLAQAADESSLLLIYFATHGFEVSSVPYLVTLDTRANVVQETAIDV